MLLHQQNKSKGLMLIAMHCLCMLVGGQLVQHDMNKSKQSQHEHLLSIDDFKKCMACYAVGTQVVRIGMRTACLKMSDEASNAILWA